MQTQPVEPRHTGHDEEQRHYIAGLLAGFSLVGRSRDMHALMEQMAQAGVSQDEAQKLTQ